MVELRLGVAEQLALVDHGVDLPVRRHVAARRGLREGLAVAGQRVGDARHAGGDVVEVLLRHLGHERKRIANGLDGRIDVVQPAQQLTAVVELQLCAHAVAQDRGGEVVHVIEVVFVVGGVRGVV